MTRASLRARLLARLHRDERGFSLLETVIAVTIMFTLMASLETSALVGFKYISLAREKQAGNQIANQVMEEMRGLAYSTLIKGITSTAQTGDSNLVTTCPGDAVGTYRFSACSGEQVMAAQASSPNVIPLVPNTGTCPGTALPICSSTTYPVTYTWKTYVTKSNTSTAPYRAIVFVSWPSKSVASGTITIRLESYFWSPTGCSSSSTTSRPFAGACQKFFYGQAIYPQGYFTVAKSTGTGVLGTTFSTGTINLPKAESDLQQEQVIQLQGSMQGTGYSVTDSSTHTGGSTTAQSTAADGDPSSSASTYQSATITAANGSWTTGSCTANNNCITFTTAANDSGTSDSATSATVSNVCPPAPATGETDSLPCGGTTTLQGGTETATANLQSPSLVPGTVTVVSLAAPASSTTTLADRDAGGTDGVTQQSVSRSIGTLNIGTVPSWITTNCATAVPAGFTSFLQLSGYSDSVQATAGSSAAAPSTTISGGTVKYWPNATLTNASTATTVTIASTTNYSIAANYTTTASCTVNSGPASSRGTMSASLTFVGATGMSSQPATSSTGSPDRTDAQASIGSPLYGTFEYKVVVTPNTGSASTPLDVFVTVDLGTISARATYAAAPTV